MEARILVTGSAGLIGRALVAAIAADGFDLRARGRDRGDVRDPVSVRRAVEGCEGVVHLAAISRVVWAERDPAGCWATNVGGLRNVLAAALDAPRPPWVIFASSREIYGRPARLPADEDCPAAPINVYGRAKLEGERLVEAARREGLRAAVVRLSNVYGAPGDHADRVVPAFARAALAGRPLRVEGADHVFDFTHIDDVVRGILAVVGRLRDAGDGPPPIHLVTGVGTRLADLARLAVARGQPGARLQIALERDFDVARFVGDPTRARAILGWRARIGVREGLARMMAALAAEAREGTGAREPIEAAPVSKEPR